MLVFAIPCKSQDEEIRLLVRGDDIGSFHAANLACIKSYQEGVMRSVEIMVPCAWFPEAVEMLNQNPGLDVGIHLVMTSEWTNMKWRPVTGKSSITDEDGYFFPMVWPNENFAARQAFIESSWKIEDMEKELRAQIDLALSKIENVSHISTHMGFSHANPKIQNLVENLAAEYQLDMDDSHDDLRWLSFDNDRTKSRECRANAMAEAILNLEPGNYIFIEHPAMDTPEMETIGHIGYTGVGKDREAVTHMFTSKVVKEAVEKKGVRLISYRDLR